MTQDERWNTRYEEVKIFIEENHRNPSKYTPEEKDMVNWLKSCRKQINAGKMKLERVKKFEKLQELGEKYKRVNQWV